MSNGGCGNENNCKKIIAFALSIIMITGIIPGDVFNSIGSGALSDIANGIAKIFSVKASADASGKYDSGISWEYNESTSTLTISGNGKMDDFDMVYNYTYKAYMTNAGWTYYSFKKVIINEGITSIGTYAFYGCSTITDITLPEGITLIDQYAFSGCKSLKKIVLPDSLETIGYRAFKDCIALSSVSGSENVSSVSSSAFDGTLLLTDTAKWTDGILYIGKCLYRADNTLIQKSVVVKDGITAIAEEAFLNCTKITSIEIPESVVEIQNKAFSGCTSLSSFSGGGSIQKIGTDVFETTAFYLDESNWDNGLLYALKCLIKADTANASGDVVLQEGTTCINQKAFYKCTKITSVTVPESVLGVGQKAFYGCTYISALKIPAGAKYIGSGIISGMSNLASLTIPFVGFSNFSYLYSDTCYVRQIKVTAGESVNFNGNNYIQSVNLADSVTDIPENGFYNCSSLSTITLSDGLKNVGKGAFEKCSNLKTINYLGTISDWCNIEFKNAYSNPVSMAQKLYVNKKLVTSVSKSDLASVNKINSYAFYNLTTLVSLEIPENVTSIGEQAFYNIGIKSLVIPDSVKTIGLGALMGVNSLEELSVPFVGESVGCDELNQTFGFIFGRTHECPQSSEYEPTTFPSGTIYQNKEGTYYVDYPFVYYYYYVPSSLKKVSITGSEKIPGYAFYNCSSLTEISLSEGIEYIAPNAFGNCSGLKQITIPASMIKLSSNSFKNCTSLESVEFVKIQPRISRTAFNNCPNLELPSYIVFEDYYLGSYPTEKVTSSSVISTLESKAVNGEAEYNGDTYVKSEDTWYKKEKIEWRTIAVSEDKMLLMSEKVLDAQAYDVFGEEVSWDESSLNSWLNEDFYNSAFTQDEKEIITSGYGIEGVSLLTSEDLLNKEYGFSSNSIYDDPERRGISTDYAVANGAESGYCNWYIRGTESSDLAHFVLNTHGCIGTCHNPVSVVTVLGIRPVICINADQSVKKLNYYVDGSLYASQKCEIGDQIKLISDPEKEGYRFNGWYSDEACTSQFETEEMPSDNINVYGKFVPQKYSVKYLSGLDDDVILEDMVSYGSVVPVPDDPSREGYAFIGWDKTVPSQMPAAELVFTAVWNKNEYTIEWVMGNESVYQTYLYGEAVVPPECTEADGKIFSEWDSEVPETMPAHNLKITAKFKTDFKVTWIVDDAETSENYTAGEKIVIPDNPQKEGYTFIGWDKEIPETMPSEDLVFVALWNANEYETRWIINSVSIKQKYSYNDIIIPPDDPEVDGFIFTGWSPEVPQKMPAQNLTFTAQFKENRYSVTWIIGETKTVETYLSGESIIIPEDPETEGYTFSGWDQEIPQYMPESNLVITAKFTLNKYSIKWKIDGTTISQSVYYGDQIEIPSDPEKEGYSFIGWTPEVPDTMPANDLTFTALWNAAEYKIIWHTGADDIVTYNRCGEKIENPDDPVSDGYSFVKWSPDIPKLMPECDLEFNAVWIKDYGIAVTGKTELNAGDTENYIAVITPEPEEQIDVNWSVSDEKIIKIDSTGNVTAVSCGTADVIADIGNGKIGKLAVTVNHNYTTITHEATCTDDGWILYNCTVCHDTYTVITEKAAGSHDYESTVFNPTCIQDGCTLNICKNCGRVSKSDVTPATGHNFADWTVVEYATESHEGLEQRHCKKCGYCEERLLPKLNKTICKATFIADNETVAVVEFTPYAESITEPAVPHKDRYDGKWSSYTLGDKDITVNAEYTLIDLDTLDGIDSGKTASYNAETGEAAINIYAASEGRTVISTSTEKVPLDIILVVDQSGSMADKLGGSTTKKNALISAANDFVNSVYEDASANGVDHRIAVVGFGSGNTNQSPYLNTEVLTTGGSPVQMNNATSATYANALMSVNKNGAINSNITSAISKIEAEGATAADLGLSMANSIFANTDGTGRQRIIVFMTDGAPTYSNTFSKDVANSAILQAYQLKNTYDATIYSVGVMSTKDTTENVTKFMDYVSSDYEDAKYLGAEYTASQEGFYIPVSNTYTLSGVFQEIVTENVTRTADFDNITVIDTVSEYFTLTSQQEKALRESVIATYGVKNSDITVTRNDDGTTTVIIKNLSPIDNGTKFEVNISFNVSANDNAAKAGTYATNTEDAGIIIGDNENYECVLKAPTVTIPADRNTAVFKVNDEIYSMETITGSETATAPETDFEGEYEFTGWDTGKGKTVSDTCTEYDAAYTSKNDYVVIWNTDEGTQRITVTPGQIIDEPTVGCNSEGSVFRRWNGTIPVTMPDHSIEFTAVYGDHEHNYEAEALKQVTCLEDGTVRYTCSVCGDTYTDTVKCDGEHSWKAVTGTNAAETGYEEFECEKCGEHNNRTLEYTLTDTKGTEGNYNSITSELNYVDGDGNKNQPDGSVNITVPVGDYFGDARDVNVYRVDGDDRIKCDSEYNYGVVSFNTDHFSTYEFVASYDGEEEHVHSYTSEVTKPASCTEDGITTYTCSCGDSYTDTIPATGHTSAEAVKENIVNATATTAGSYDEVVYCSVCKAELSRVTKAIPAGFVSASCDRTSILRGQTVTWTVTTSTNVVWLRFNGSYTTAAGDTKTMTLYYKNTNWATDADGVRTWTIPITLSYTVSDDSITESWKIDYKLSGSSKWNTAMTASGEYTSSVDIYRNAELMPVAYAAYTLISVDVNNTSASAGDKITFTVKTTNDVTKVRIGHNYTADGVTKTKSVTYQTTSSNQTHVDNGDGTMTWTITYKVPATASGETDFNVQVRGTAWGTAQSKTITVA